MILVTGATGMVGGNLLVHLLQRGLRVRATRRANSNTDALRVILNFYHLNPDDYLSQIEWVDADITDGQRLAVVMEGVDEVYHCAAMVAFGNNPEQLYRINVEGTRHVVHAAMLHRVKRFCYVSSIATLGNALNHELVNEYSERDPNRNYSPYSKTKFEAERIVMDAVCDGLNAVIVNPGVILGVSGGKTGSSQLFDMAKKGMPFYTNGGSGYVDVRDVVKAMVDLMECGCVGERFVLVAENCCNRQILSWMATGFGTCRPFVALGKYVLFPVAFVNELLARVFNRTPLMDLSTARTALGFCYYSSEKIKKQLGFEFISIETSIAQISSYLRNC